MAIDDSSSSSFFSPWPDRLRHSAIILLAAGLALTAYAGVEDVKRAHLAGFQRHLAKPVTPEHLVEAIAGLARAAPV